ncbi:MAG: arylsulfatase [Verrucomicrobia bacterium]|nr:arylsulfatase [Verrucomicrobiota bacterium]MDA1066235.1 arylsulfatase [Verrucomicrobiota bacterium]
MFSFQKSVLPLISFLSLTIALSAAKPNVVYVLADDLGWGDLSCFNQESKIHTPHLDRIAAAGMRFTDAHSGSGVCTPTRYGIVTGRYSWRSRLKRGVLGGASTHLINTDRYTVADLMKDQGYHTAMIGKWHLGWDFAYSKGGPNDQYNLKTNDVIDYNKPVKNGPDALGFDYYYGHCGSLDMAPYVYVENGKITAPPDRITVNQDYKGFWREGLTGSDFNHTQTTPNFVNRAINYIDKQSQTKQPFFLYLPLPSPHTPILPISEFMGKSNTNFYGDFVMQVDWHMGQIMEALERNGIAEDTLFIFTSDNGCSPRAVFEELDAVGHKPGGIFRGNKADIYEAGHRVPFIAHWPKGFKGGSSSEATVCLTDLFATLAEITGAKVPKNAAEDSVSFYDSLKGNTKQHREATVHHSINGSFAIRKGDWKLVLCPGSGGWSYPTPNETKDLDLPPIQLFNLRSDPSETTNVYSANHDKVRELYRLLTSYVENGRSTPGPKQSNEENTPFDPAGFEKLKAELNL